MYLRPLFAFIQPSETILAICRTAPFNEEPGIIGYSPFVIISLYNPTLSFENIPFPTAKLDTVKIFKSIYPLFFAADLSTYLFSSKYIRGVLNSAKSELSSYSIFISRHPLIELIK